MYKLTRLNDQLVRQSQEIRFVEWDEDGKFKEMFMRPKEGLSLIMSPFNFTYTWLTTTIEEIHRDEEDFISFRTKNSEYELKRTED